MEHAGLQRAVAERVIKSQTPTPVPHLESRCFDSATRKVLCLETCKGESFFLLFCPLPWLPLSVRNAAMTLHKPDSQRLFWLRCTDK